MTGREVPTRHGPARLHRIGRARGGAATLVLGHGAGGGVDAPDLQQAAAAVAAHGHAVVLVEQPWRVAGRRLAPRPAVLDEGWIDALRALRPAGPLVAGGRSAGARVACRTAAEVGAAGVVALAFPLHPPGRPERSRRAELIGCPVPLLVVQGSGDAFGTPAEVRAAGRVPVVGVAGSDHSLRRGDLGPAIDRILRFLAAAGE